MTHIHDKSQPTVAKKYVPSSDKEYLSALNRMQKAATILLTDFRQLFTTDIDPDVLWKAYLAAIPEPQRQISNCNTCHSFIKRYGGLVVMEPNGNIFSPWFTENSDVHVALKAIIARSKVTGVFYSKCDLGTPQTDQWYHIAFRLPEHVLHKDKLHSADAAMAHKAEDYRTLMHALEVFKKQHLETALQILEADALPNSERFIGPVRWLLERQTERKTPLGRNLIWQAVAEAPAGFCSPRTNTIGTLLEDIEAGLSFETIKRRFTMKVDPLRFQRAQTAPAAGTIKQAEDAFAKLGLGPALERRFATVLETPKIWTPSLARKDESASGLFGHLYNQPSPLSPLNLPIVTCTWVKFRDTVLEGADKIEFYTNPMPGPYSAMVTAVHADAPPLFAWDNPFSWYVYHGGSTSSRWQLPPAQYVPVTGLATQPSNWEKPMPHFGDSLFFMLQGARDLQSRELGIFPAFVRSDLHSVRSVIEAYSKSRRVEMPEGVPLASGYVAEKGQIWNIRLRVTTGKTVQEYLLDRWD